jgi:uncharacterized protein YjiS (DUF1127 family)
LVRLRNRGKARLVLLEQTMSHTLPGSVPFSGGGLDLHASRRTRITTLARTLSSTIGLWSARSRQRRALGHLAELNSHLLNDIGVTPDEALREAAKWFWQPGGMRNSQASQKNDALRNITPLGT